MTAPASSPHSASGTVDGSPRFSAQTLATLMGLPTPTPEQAAVIEAPLSPVLVVAGAGSGKTETMSSRVLFLIANGLMEPREILGLTFTRKAAFELEERISRRLRTLASALEDAGEALPPALERSRDDLVGQRPTVQTYNGFALDLVKEHALRIGIDPDFTVLSPAGSWQLAYDIVSTWPGALPFTQSPATIASALTSLAGSLADHLVTPEQLEDYLGEVHRHTQNLPLQEEGRRTAAPKLVKRLWTILEQRAQLVPMLQRFEQVKRERSVIDFADQVSLAAQIAARAPEVPALMRSSYSAVLLDEFQDTSVAQLQLLADLFGSGHATTAVGDPNQAIYGWRGASAASLTTFVERFGTESTPVLQRSLSTSWRNDSAVLSAANAISRPLSRSDDPVNVPELTTRPGAGVGRIRAERFAESREEAAAIAAWIRDARELASADPALRDAPAPSAAVLIRARRMIPLVEEALTAAGLPHHTVGGGGLLNQPEVADVRALLEAADSSAAGASAVRLLAGPRFCLSRHDLAVLGEWTKQLSRRTPVARRSDDAAASLTVVDAIDAAVPYDFQDATGRRMSEAGQQRVRQLRDMLRRLRQNSALPLADQVDLAIRELGVDLALIADPDRDPAYALANLHEFRTAAADYDDGTAERSLAAFLAFLTVTEQKESGFATAVDASLIPEDAVTITTMHGAKGLEWDMVAIAGLNDGAFPSYDSRSTDGTDEATGLERPKDHGWLGTMEFASIPTELRGDSHLLSELAWAEPTTQVGLEEVIEEFFLNNGEERLREERRLMYVALTRAKHDLLLTSSAWRPDATKPAPPSRFLGELLAAGVLTELPSAEIPEENPLASTPPSAQWPESPSPRAAEVQRIIDDIQRGRTAADLAAAVGGLAAAAADEDAASTDVNQGREADAITLGADQVIAAHEDRADRSTVELPLRLSASDLVALAEENTADRALDMLRPLPKRPGVQAATGTQFHAWVERATSNAALLEVEEVDDDAPDTTLTQLREKFEQSAFARMKPLAVEEPVAAVLGSAVTVGVIDAVFPDPEDPEGVWIVDWKTGRVPSRSELDARALQLSIYRLAWHQRTGVPLAKIRTFFHYVAAERTMEITRHRSRADLEAMISAERWSEGPGRSERSEEPEGKVSRES